MRTRDWRRAQREKRTSAAHERATRMFARNVERARCGNWMSLIRRADSTSEAERARLMRYYLVDEGRHWWQRPFHTKRCYDDSPSCACSWCLSSRLRAVNRQHEAMDYDLRLLDWNEPDECTDEWLEELNYWNWQDFLRDEEMQAWYQFDAPIPNRIRGFLLCLPTERTP